MYELCCKAQLRMLMVLLAAGYAAPAMSLRFSAGIGDELRYTDNAALSEVDAVDDLVNTASVSVGVAEQSGATQWSLDSSLRALNYTKGTFDNVNFVTANANADWQMIQGRLSWKVTDSFRQQRINSLDPGVPTNLQDINVFSFGPDITIPLSSSQQLLLQPQYRRTYYETSVADNQQYVFGASWQYRIRKAMSLVVSGNTNKVSYDASSFDFESRTIDAGITGSFSRSDYTLTAGITHIQRDAGASQRGSNVSANWNFNASKTFTLGVSASSQFTEAGNVLLNATQLSADDINNLQDDSDTLQIATGVLRNKSAGLNLNKIFKRLTVGLAAGVSRSDYDGATSDRDIKTVSLSLGYGHTARLSSKLDFRYNNTQLDDDSREDTTRVATFSMNYNLSRKLTATASLLRNQRDSNVAINAYDENSITLAASYQF